jgi:hypothetical protein
MITLYYTLLLSTIHAVLGSADHDRTSLTIDAVIQNVRLNEDIYRNLEIVEEFNYKLFDAKYFPPDALKSIEETSHCVYQDDLYYVRDKRSTKEISGVSSRGVDLVGYDGSKTVMVNRQPIANIRDGRYDGYGYLYPHTILFSSDWLVRVKLSDFLAGDPDLKKNKFAEYLSNYIVPKSFVEHEEIIDGLRSIKIRIEERLRHDHDKDNPANKLISMMYLWLSIDRNYLPVKAEKYYSIYGLNRPMEFGSTVEWKEIENGIWFPIQCNYDVYDGNRFLEDKKIVLCNTSIHRFTVVDLHPHRPNSFFANISIPDGYTVYVVNNQGGILKSYVQGGRNALGKTPFGFNRLQSGLILIFSTLAVLMCVIVVRHFVKRQSRLE